MESPSTTPPEVVFHRYFQKDVRRSGMEHIKGKQDLSQLPDDLGSFLTNVQRDFNQSFSLSCHSLEKLGRPSTLHLDYFESEKVGAHAFESEGFFFIGVTIPFIHQLRDSAERLVRAENVVALLGLKGCSVQRLHSAIGGILSVKLLFVVAHEVGHHLVGHTSNFAPVQLKCVKDFEGKPALEQQTEEIMADSYAVSLALDLLIGGRQGRLVLEMLRHGSAIRSDDSNILMSAVLLAAFSLFSEKSAEPLDSKSLYTLDHPPAIVRINAIIQSARCWCQLFSPSLASWLTNTHVEEIMNAEESSRPGSEGLWVRQITFFMSSDGMQYFEILGNQLSRISPAGMH